MCRSTAGLCCVCVSVRVCSRENSQPPIILHNALKSLLLEGHFHGTQHLQPVGFFRSRQRRGQHFIIHRSKRRSFACLLCSTNVFLFFFSGQPLRLCLSGTQQPCLNVCRRFFRACRRRCRCRCSACGWSACSCSGPWRRRWRIRTHAGCGANGAAGAVVGSGCSNGTARHQPFQRRLKAAAVQAPRFLQHGRHCGFLGRQVL